MTSRRSGKLSFIPAEAIFDTRLSHATVRILAALGTYAGKSGHCWPSAGTLAERLAINERTVRRALDRLERHGYIATERRLGQSSIYRMRRTLVSRVPWTKESEVEPEPRTLVSGTPDIGVQNPGHECPTNDIKNDTNNDYAFHGKVIRLNQRDFNTWAKSYPHIDLRAELQALDDWYDGHLTAVERKNWFARCSGALAKKNREAKTRAPSRSTYNPDVIH